MRWRTALPPQRRWRRQTHKLSRVCSVSKVLLIMRACSGVPGYQVYYWLLGSYSGRYRTQIPPENTNRLRVMQSCKMPIPLGKPYHILEKMVDMLFKLYIDYPITLTQRDAINQCRVKRLHLAQSMRQPFSRLRGKLYWVPESECSF